MKAKQYLNNEVVIPTKTHDIDEIITRYNDFKSEYLLEKIMFIEIIKNNNISCEQELVNLLLQYPECLRREFQFQYKCYENNPQKYLSEIPKNIRLL